MHIQTEHETVCVYKPYSTSTHLICTCTKGKAHVKLNGWLSWPEAAAARQTWARKAKALQLQLNIRQSEELNSSPQVTEMTIFKIKEAFSAEGWTEWFKHLVGLSVIPSGPQKHHSHSCLVSTWNLAGCDCAEKGNTFQAYHGVRGLEEPIGGQLTAQSLRPATTENKKALSGKISPRP